MKHLHLDLVGGLSGDMFIGAMLDIFPGKSADLEALIRDAGFADLVTLGHEPHNDGTLTGTRFTVQADREAAHHHRHYADIRETLAQSHLAEPTKAVAQSIFRLIAEVEAKIHGKTVESVAFHEVGAWDSIADIVIAAHLIADADATWSVSEIPLGRGFVETAHGRLPVPAPATAMLLEGFDVTDDGIEGERVTPTGAAILKHLSPVRTVPGGVSLAGTGFGFGTRRFPGISNVVQISVFESSETESPWQSDQVVRLCFELDDMTPESLAASLDTLREEPGVLDVMQQSYFGKKQRQGMAVSVLVNADNSDPVTSKCFELTTTLGVRRERLERAVLRREEVVVYVSEKPYRVKVAHRPSGATAKIEMDDLAASGLSQADQERVRHEAESLAVQQVQR